MMKMMYYVKPYTPMMILGKLIYFIHENLMKDKEIKCYDT